MYNILERREHDLCHPSFREVESPAPPRAARAAPPRAAPAPAQEALLRQANDVLTRGAGQLPSTAIAYKPVNDKGTLYLMH